MNVVVPLFLLAPLILVPLGYRLLEIASPGSRPPAVMLRSVVPAAGLLVIAFWLPAGPVAAVLAGPWLAVTGVTALAAGLRWLRDPLRSRPEVRHATDAAVAFLAVGAAFAFTDRLGLRPFDFPTPVILLTAVHFHFAGFVLPVAGALAYSRRPRRWLELAIGAVVVGIPITALGFFGLPIANWVGAVLTASGGFGIGLATLAIVRTLDGRGATIFAVIAGASLLISMPMAVIYATGTLTGAAWLGMDVMARLHGSLNAVGFALPAMLAWTLDRLARTPAEPARVAAEPASVPVPSRDPRTLGLGVAVVIAAYAGLLGLVAANGRTDEVGPSSIASSLMLVALLSLPAAIAAIGAVRRSQALLTAAGVLCLVQSVIAFSGATIPFAIPGIALLTLASRTGRGPLPGRAGVGAIGVIALAVASWFALLGLTETVCWVARAGADGALVYTRVPVADTMTLQVGDAADGCDGGAATAQGIALAAMLAVGAVVVAGRSSRPESAATG
jgi:hypothetical protein